MSWKNSPVARTVGMTIAVLFMIGSAVIAQADSPSNTQLLAAINQLQTMVSAQSHIADSVWCRKVETQIESLQRQLVQLDAKQSNTPATNDQWLALAADIAALKAENQQLREMLTGQTGQLASLDDASQVRGTETVLSKRVSSLASQIDALLKQRQESAQVDQTAEPGLSVSGFVDASSYTDHNARTSSFGLDQVEVDIEKSFSNQATVRADLEYLNDGQGGFEFGLEQGYVQWSVGGNWKWDLAFGKFNVPMGYECADPTDMYQYSCGLVSAYCIPGNVTGVLVTLAAPKVVSWSLYAVNGWDVNSDNNKDKTIGSRVALSLNERFLLGLSTITGPEIDDNNSARRTVLDCDITYTLRPSWLIGTELNTGWESKTIADTGTASWSGVLLMTNLKFATRFGLTLRGDYLNDRDGNRTGTAQEVKSLSMSPSVSIVEGFGALMEIRHDWSNQPSFAGSDGQPKSSQMATAFEFTYAF